VAGNQEEEKKSWSYDVRKRFFKEWVKESTKGKNVTSEKFKSQNGGEDARHAPSRGGGEVKEGHGGFNADVSQKKTIRGRCSPTILR